MTNHLRKLANGKIVLVLEGGYELNALAECGKLCVEALLGRQVRFLLIMSIIFLFNLDAIVCKKNSRNETKSICNQ